MARNDADTESQQIVVDAWRRVSADVERLLLQGREIEVRDEQNCGNGYTACILGCQCHSRNPSLSRLRPDTVHFTDPRPITLREASLLQGFPRNYYFDHRVSLEATALIIGNALPPAFVAFHAKEVAKKLLCS